MGAWRRNLWSASLPARRWCQRRWSASVAFWRRVRARSVRGFGDFTSLFWERAARLASLSGGCALLTGPNPSPTSAKLPAAQPSYPPPLGRSASGNPLLWERIGSLGRSEERRVGKEWVR